MATVVTLTALFYLIGILHLFLVYDPSTRNPLGERLLFATVAPCWLLVVLAAYSSAALFGVDNGAGLRSDGEEQGGG